MPDVSAGVVGDDQQHDDADYRWGKPFSALLGALDAQLELGAAAIGGKDSMSGSFLDLDVPPTLISFAIAIPLQCSLLREMSREQAANR